MAATSLSNAIEESTYVVTVDFTNEDGDALEVKSVTWTLTDVSGNVINSRENEEATPGSSVNIVLSGDDLAIIPDVSNKRILTVDAVYDSSYGTDLPLKGRAEFTIEDLTAV